MSRGYTSVSSRYLSHAAAVLSATPFTMACWAMPTSSTGAIRALMSVNTSGSSDNVWLLAIDASDNVIARARTTTQTSSVTAGTVTNNAWNFCAAIYTSGTSRNAVLGATIATTDTVSKSPSGVNQTYIGRNANTANYMNGNIAEAAIWNVALTQNEITMLSKGVNPLNIRPASIVAYWPLIGRASPELDPVGGFNMTLNGSPPQAAHPPVLRHRTRTEMSK